MKKIFFMFITITFTLHTLCTLESLNHSNQEEGPVPFGLELSEKTIKNLDGLLKDNIDRLKKASQETIDEATNHIFRKGFIVFMCCAVVTIGVTLTNTGTSDLKDNYVRGLGEIAGGLSIIGGTGFLGYHLLSSQSKTNNQENLSTNT